MWRIPQQLLTTLKRRAVMYEAAVSASSRERWRLSAWESWQQEFWRVAEPEDENGCSNNPCDIGKHAVLVMYIAAAPPRRRPNWGVRYPSGCHPLREKYRRCAQWFSATSDMMSLPPSGNTRDSVNDEHPLPAPSAPCGTADFPLTSASHQ